MTAVVRRRFWLRGSGGLVVLCGALILGDYVVGRALRTESRCVVMDQLPDSSLVPTGSSFIEGSDFCRPCDVRERSVDFLLLPDRHSSEVIDCPLP